MVKRIISIGVLLAAVFVVGRWTSQPHEAAAKPVISFRSKLIGSLPRFVLGEELFVRDYDPNRCGGRPYLGDLMLTSQYGMKIRDITTDMCINSIGSRSADGRYVVVYGEAFGVRNERPSGVGILDLVTGNLTVLTDWRFDSTFVGVEWYEGNTIITGARHATDAVYLEKVNLDEMATESLEVPVYLVLAGEIKVVGEERWLVAGNHAPDIGVSKENQRVVAYLPQRQELHQFPEVGPARFIDGREGRVIYFTVRGNQSKLWRADPTGMNAEELADWPEAIIHLAMMTRDKESLVLATSAGEDGQLSWWRYGFGDKRLEELSPKELTLMDVSRNGDMASYHDEENRTFGVVDLNSGKRNKVCLERDNCTVFFAE